MTSWFALGKEMERDVIPVDGQASRACAVAGLTTGKSMEEVYFDLGQVFILATSLEYEDDNQKQK